LICFMNEITSSGRFCISDPRNSSHLMNRTRPVTRLFTDLAPNQGGFQWWPKHSNRYLRDLCQFFDQVKQRKALTGGSWW
jgi:hypothetical protein